MKFETKGPDEVIDIVSWQDYVVGIGERYVYFLMLIDGQLIQDKGKTLAWDLDIPMPIKATSFRDRVLVLFEDRSIRGISCDWRTNEWRHC